MSNMSYCRFENTSRDMQDCIYAMQEADDIPGMDLSSHELAAMRSMARQAQEFLEQLERLDAATTKDRL